MLIEGGRNGVAAGDSDVQFRLALITREMWGMGVVLLGGEDNAYFWVGEGSCGIEE